MKEIIKVTDKNYADKRRIFVDKIVSYGKVRSNWNSDTKIELVGGTVIYVKETVEQIDGLIDGSINECNVEF